MSPTGQKLVRGHLRVAYTPPPPPDAPPRVVLFVRAMILRVRLFLLNLVALGGAILALAPLLARRHPIGHRTQVPRRPARVISLTSRRRAAPP